VYYGFLRHKLWFDEGCSELFDQVKQDNCSGYRGQVEINGDNLNNVRYEANRHFRNKRMIYLRGKFNELATTSKIKVRDLYRGIN
jgi:hypothetical protein